VSALYIDWWTYKYIWKLNNHNQVSGVMINVLTSSVVGRGLEPRSGQTIASSPKQQSVGKHVSSLGHIILILNQPIFAHAL
jgi:hypothetical protein